MKTWSEAEADCKSRGHQLATVMNAADSARLVTAARGENVWIGATSPNNVTTQIPTDWHRTWRWGSAKGAPVVDYTNWNGGEPNDDDGEGDCVMVRQQDGRWNDRICREWKRYICQAPCQCHCAQ